MHSLLFFCALITGSGCESYESDQILVFWKDQKTMAVIVPEIRLPKEKKTDLLAGIGFRVRGANTNIIGNIQWDDGILFEPSIPFTAGLRYQVFFRDQLIDSFSIPFADSTLAPALVQIYPSPDTVPMNLLKIYLQFSQPMRENVSAKYVRLIQNKRDTLADVFLDLQPELWNEDRTVLTLWLDPGRIKRDLQPNQRMGNPLKEGTRYQLFVEAGWTSAQGLYLSKNSIQDFVVGQRDSLSPDPQQWTIVSPQKNTRQPLLIRFGESLDHFLLMESLNITTKSGKLIKGKWLISAGDDQCSFEPETPWIAGEYILEIDAKLEDLAGNNLNKPFDRDITQTKTPSTTQVYQRSFSIR